MFWLNIHRDFTPKNKDVLEFLLMFQQQYRQLTFLIQITLYKDGNFLFPKMAAQGKCRELIDNFLKCSITANYDKDASRCQLLISTFFDTCYGPSPIENYRSLYITRTKHYLMFLANIYKYIKWNKTCIAVTRLQISTLSRESKEIAAIQCSDLLSSPVCWQNYLVDILRKTIGKIIWTHFPEISLMYNSSYRWP